MDKYLFLCAVIVAAVMFMNLTIIEMAYGKDKNNFTILGFVDGVITTLLIALLFVSEVF